MSGIINIISGGEPSSKDERKRTRKEVFVAAEDSIPNIIINQDNGSHVKQSHNDASVINVYVKNYLVKRMLVDDRNTVNILIWESF